MAKRPPKKAMLTCSFCGRGDRADAVVIPGPDVNICSDCVDICTRILAENNVTPASSAALPVLHVPPPGEIKTFLDQYIVGHD
ncbi:MAG TPA: ClpX C4-type zinc finger protein, partial [Kiritimatiellia bacterium]|nr:ClpX C4-type zinc finger protein [Kiritimatiellia bacterium]